MTSDKTTCDGMTKESYATDIIGALKDTNLVCDEEVSQIYAYLTA